MPVIAVKASRRTIGFKPKKHGYLRLSVHRPHKHRAPVFCDLAKGVPSADGAGRCHFQHALTTCSYQLADRTHLCGLGGEDVGVTGVDDGHGGATEELTASGTELDLYYGKKFKSVKVGPSKDSLRVCRESFFSGLQSIYVLQSDDQSSFARHAIFFFLSQSGVIERTLLPVKWWTAVLPSME